MVELWLNSSSYLNLNEEGNWFKPILSDVEMFIPHFESAMQGYGINYQRVYSKRKHNLAPYPFKYGLSKFRLTSFGMIIYHSLLQEHL
jgi:hypothetical protein